MLKISRTLSVFPFRLPSSRCSMRCARAADRLRLPMRVEDALGSHLTDYEIRDEYDLSPPELSRSVRRGVMADTSAMSFTHPSFRPRITRSGDSSRRTTTTGSICSARRHSRLPRRSCPFRCSLIKNSASFDRRLHLSGGLRSPPDFAAWGSSPIWRRPGATLRTTTASR